MQSLTHPPTPTVSPIPRSQTSTPSSSHRRSHSPSSPDYLESRPTSSFVPDADTGSSSHRSSSCYPFPSSGDADPEHGAMNPYAFTVASQFNSRAATMVHVDKPGHDRACRCGEDGRHVGDSGADKEMKVDMKGVSKEVSNTAADDPDTHSPSCFAWGRTLPCLNRRRKSNSISTSDQSVQNKQRSSIGTDLFSSITGTLTLENSGSVARDHLASERTFLAYVRTSLGCSTMGVALVQLFELTPPTSNASRLHKVGTALGAATVAVGLAIMFTGLTRYFRTQSVLIDGSFRPAGSVVHTIAGVLSLLVIVIFAVLVGVVE